MDELMKGLMECLCMERWRLDGLMNGWNDD